MDIVPLLIILFSSTILTSNAQLCETLAANLTIGEVSEKCETQLMTACLNGSLLWQLFDASSKYPISGLSYSNNRDLGNFDECMSINYEDFDGVIKGKHCAYSVAIVNPLLNDNTVYPYAAKIEPKALAQFNYKEINHDEFMRVTKDAKADTAVSFVTTIISVCIPDACTPREVSKFFIWGQLENTLVFFVDETTCITKDSYSTLEWYDILFITFLSLIGVCIIYSTAYDILIEKLQTKPKHPVLLAFSFKTNGRKLFHIGKGGSEQIQCLNGLRFISMMWVIAGHNYVAVEDLPINNYAEIIWWKRNYWSQLMLSAPISVDTFFFLSGFVLAYGYIKKMKNIPWTKQILSIPMVVVHRYLRITPAMAVLFFLTVTIFRFLGTGPLWNAVMDIGKDQCLDNWWSFFIYVQNYVVPDDMCLNHTWYLSADMQMFVLSPIVLIPLTILLRKKLKAAALWSLGILTVIAVIVPILTKLFDESITNVYLTHDRFNNYLIGIILGVIFREFNDRPYPFTKLQNFIIWAVVLLVTIGWNAYFHDVLVNYDHTKETLFYGLYRPVWCASLAWMVYSCYHGYGGPVNAILSLPAFQVGARLSYCMYLLHAVIEMYWLGITRTGYYWGDYQIFYLWCGHFIITMIASTIWSLLFESPMIIIEKQIFGGSGGSRPPKKEDRS